MHSGPDTEERRWIQALTVANGEVAVDLRHLESGPLYRSFGVLTLAWPTSTDRHSRRNIPHYNTLLRLQYCP